MLVWEARIRLAWTRIEVVIPQENVMQGEQTISTKDLKAKLGKDKNFVVVETLAPDRFRESHIPGALNIPPDKIKELAPQLLPDKEAEIVTYCSNFN